LLFLASGQDNVFDDDVDEQPIQDLALKAQENRVALDAEQLLFLASGQDNVFDDDVDEQPIQDLALNVENVFQANDCDAFDFDVDEASTSQTCSWPICHLQILLQIKPDHHMIRTFSLSMSGTTRCQLYIVVLHLSQLMLLR
nr:integrase, catalytic region, zinc finger, CCHC-type, peptidase aspartic, catalytic [Tanacetum cinerariifolium]